MWLKRISWIAIGIISVISILLGSKILQIQFDYDLELFFPEKDPNTLFFKRYRQIFEGDNDYVLIGIVNEEGIFKQRFLNQIDQLTDSLQGLPNVKSVIGPTKLREYQRPILSRTLTSSPFIHLNAPGRYTTDSIKIFSTENLAKPYFSKDKKAVLLYLKHQELLDDQAAAALQQAVTNTVASFPFDKVYYAGKSFGQTYYIQLIQREVMIFIGAAVAIVILFLWFSYRRFWGIWMPMTIVGLTVLWTMGFMVLTNKPIDLISNIIPTILLVIGISDVVHILTNYLILLAEGVDRKPALKKTIEEVGIATLITTFTTAIGFLSLSTSSFRPLIDLGLYATLGLIIALFLSYTLLPAILLLLPPLYQERSGPFRQFWKHKLEISFNWVLTHQNSILWGTAVIMLFALVGMSKLKVNNYLLEDLRANDPQQIAFNYFGDQFDGARSFELSVMVKDTTMDVFHPEVLQQLEKLDSFLITSYGIGNLVSPAQLIKYANQVYHQGESAFFKIPEEQTFIKQLVQALSTDKGAIDVEKYIARNQMQARISGKMPDLGSFTLKQKNDTLLHFIDQHTSSKHLQFQLTGTPHLLDLNNSYLAQNVLQGLLIAIVIIGILLAFLLRSIKMAWISLIPNLLPLMIVGGIMGYFGIDLKISTSIIFIIAFGIAVDDSIHFLSRFRREIQQQPSVFLAVQKTYFTSGKAILLTSLILVGGFSTLCLSNFLGTFYLGLLVSITLLIALVADLVLLPVLLLRYYKR